MQILLTNDDGILAPGISVMRAALEGLGEVRTIAPAVNASAIARGITIDRPLCLDPVGFGGGWHGLACDGTPSDCVRVGFLGIDGGLPDLVVSGVNLGANMGADVTYSGTVGAAFEAALRGRAGIAFSVESRTPRWLPEAVPVLRGIVRRVVHHGLPPFSILNVNLPDTPGCEFKGIRPARLGGASRHDKVFLSGDGDGHVPLAVPITQAHRDPLLAAAEAPSPAGDDVGVDFDVVAAGYIAVTPLRYDLLYAEFLSDLATWDLDRECHGV